MSIYSGWQQIDGMDDVLGAGGICQDVAAAMIQALSENGIDDALTIHSSVGENHVFVVALIPDDGVYEIDIPPSVYEIGSGYVWTKRENIVIGADDVFIQKIDEAMDVASFEETYAL